jgi:hypothetical protein
VVTVGITHCGYCGVASCCVCIINKAIMGPSNATILVVVVVALDGTIIALLIIVSIF